jgi:hypothetical protein
MVSVFSSNNKIICDKSKFKLKFNFPYTNNLISDTYTYLETHKIDNHSYKTNNKDYFKIRYFNSNNYFSLTMFFYKSDNESFIIFYNFYNGWINNIFNFIYHLSNYLKNKNKIDYSFLEYYPSNYTKNDYYEDLKIYSSLYRYIYNNIFIESIFNTDFINMLMISLEEADFITKTLIFQLINCMYDYDKKLTKKNIKNKIYIIKKNLLHKNNEISQYNRTYYINLLKLKKNINF